MFKKVLSLFLPLCLLLGACGTAPAGTTGDEPVMEGKILVATTYPIYLIASELVRDVVGVQVQPLINQTVTCLHDYTLSVNDMKMLEGADIVLHSGADLDDFIEDAIENLPEVKTIEASDNLPLLAGKAHEHEEDADEHEEDADEDALVDDPHFWLNPLLVAQALDNIARELGELDPDNRAAYAKNAAAGIALIEEAYPKMKAQMDTLSNRKLITFHDGFGYFADAFGLELLLAIEEEENNAASAQVIQETVTLIETHQIPAIFTETYSSDATLKAIVQEVSFPVGIHRLSSMMNGKTENAGIALYLSALQANLDILSEALA